MAVPGARALREWFTFTSSLWSGTSSVGSAANHSEMLFLSCYTLKLPFPSSSPCICASSTSSSSSGAVWVCADSRGRGGERHPESASSVKAPHPPPSSSPRSLSTGFLCPLKTDISLCPSFSSLCFSSSVSASSSPLYILYTCECRARYLTWIHIRKDLASEYDCWSGICVVFFFLFVCLFFLKRFGRESGPAGSDLICCETSDQPSYCETVLAIWTLVLYNCDVVPEHTVLVPLKSCLRDVKWRFLFQN